jgi:peroxiredoxin Q/BCP
MTVAAGQPAPDFTLPSAEGEVTLSDLGRPAVLYFYPRDDTPGCTKEAIAFSGLLPEFEALGVAVYGISKDPAGKHEKFAAKHELTVPLLSDAESDVCERYGVWVEKSMYGRKSMGIERATFLVDASGTVREVWRKVKVPGHAEAVLDTAKTL